MEILHNYRENGYFTAKLYHLLARKKLVDSSEEIIPSIYQKEMSMSTTERLQNLNAIEVDNIIRHGGQKADKVVLSFTPRIIVFQNFKPNDRIVAKFSVKNISKAPTYLNMVYKESSYFSIKPCGAELLSRLAPGISFTFAITFNPVQYEDYTHRVTFHTDVDQYVLPLIAMGPRPVFDFPDEVLIPSIPLKIENYFIILIHNVGMVPAGFTLNTKCPFSVQPKSAYLSPNQKIDVRISFKTMHLGETQGILYALFETGENFRIKVSGNTHTVSVELEKEKVRFTETYTTMVRQQTFKITNKSDHLLTYMCMKNDCVYYDFEDKVKLATIFYGLKESESTKHRKLVQYDVLSSDEHERVYTRIFFDEIQALVADETLSFQNTHFAVTPIKGKLWPNKTTELTITFCPQEIGEFSATAYLDIDGIMDRVPLTMVGTSMPPSIQLNLENLDMDCVYINKTYNYEVVAINKGHINGVILYKEVPTLFGSLITCTPEMHCLRPGDKEIFVISFCNSSQGPYFEEVNFVIRNTDVVLKLYLKGTVIYPTLIFSISCLDFGMVSVGVPKTLEVEVINESVVNVKATVKISSDGPEVSSITLEDCAVAENPKLEFPQWPREFKIEPSKVEIGPESRISLTVTLIANLTRANQTSIELELEKSDSPPIILPVTFMAMVPEITPAPDINLRACFLDYTYKHEISVSSNDFYGFYTIEEPEEESTLIVDVGVKRGLIEPNSTLTLPVSIMTKILGVQEFTLRMHLFGLSKPIDICCITGCGVRPIVTCTPIALHWGQVKLLTRTQKVLTLCNDSPVHVFYKAFLLNRDGRWQINPAEGCIEPEGETDLTLSLYLVDADTYLNKAVIQLEKVKDILVPLSATGVGTSIVVGDQRDKIVLGRHFTKIPLNCKIMIENCGTRLHGLDWSEFFKPPKTKHNPAPFFNLEPRSFKLGAGEKVELIVTALSTKVSTVKEMWYLIGSVEGINKKELLLECQVIAEFVDPKIEVSSPMMNFRYDYGPYSEYYKLTDILTIKNVSKLPLDIDINIKPPFGIIQKQGTYKVLLEEENMCCCITYNESDLNVPKIVKESGLRQSKIFIDFLTAQPVEPLRKGKLKFFEDISKIKMSFNVTHSIEERLKDQEVMKIQILFDTTKHTTLKSKVFCDMMKIKFKGHKNKDAIKITGKINFPNILILTPKVDFRCIQNGSLESKTIKLQNVTPLMVCYKFQWRKHYITTVEVPELPNIEYTASVNTAKEGTEKSGSGDRQEILGVETPPVTDVDVLENEDVIKEVASEIQDDVEEVVEDFKVTKTKLIKKIAPMIDTEYLNNDFMWTCKLFKLVKYNNININELFQLTPHRGLLKPNDVQFVHVIFRPRNNLTVKATLECEVLGGPSEYVTVTGQSSELMYTLNSNKINFKIRSFHENATEKLIITNIASLPFEYKTYLNEPKFENELQGVIRELVPPEKILEPEEVAEIEIVIKPGVVGYFNRVFILEIGHLPHISIEVFGWGVIPQVYLSLQRPYLSKLPVELGYNAIATLTLEYLGAISETFLKGDTEHLNTPQIEKCFEDPHFQQNWHICSSWDGYPSTMDIELAIERMLVINHIKLRPDLLTTYSSTAKMGPISGFFTSHYLIDYGVVITGSTVQCIAEIINYGPIATKLHFAKYSRPPSWLSLKLCGKLNPGETGKLEVTFSPTNTAFSELEHHVETSFNIEVSYGVTIPVDVKALCAVPYLASNVTEVCFGGVRCGEKVITSIPLRNVGKPTCVWYVTLRLKAPGSNPMSVLESSGKYEPGEGGWLNIAFKPVMEIAYEGMLIFRFHMNPNKLIIPVTGQGILPHVHIIGPNVKFAPTLPWAETTDVYFGLTNPCPFPIELIVVHSDEKFKEDDEIFQLLLKYYNKPEEMLVPAVRPGAGMAPEVVNFYRSFKDNVKRNIDEEAAAAAKISSAKPANIKKAKSPKNASKNATTLPPPAHDVTPPRRFRTEAEIIADEIKTMKEEGVDPLKEAKDRLSLVTENDSADEIYLKGLLVFVHGSPCEEMQCQEMAYTLGKRIGLPTINIDLCIVDALCVSNTPSKSLILSAVNEMYEATQKLINKDTDVDDNVNLEDDFEGNEDDFDTILRKITFLANNKNVGAPRTKTGDKKKLTSSPTSHTALGALSAIGSTTLFQMDVLQSLLTDYFSQQKFEKGFIVDSLTSNVIKNPPLVITTILKCKHTIRNIHLVLCQSDFSKWAQAYEEKIQRETEVIDENIPKVYTDTEIEEIIKVFEDMDETEFENASSELKAIYIAHGLETRRKKHLDKIGVSAEQVLNVKKDRVIKENKSATAMEASESKKKIKKEDGKGKPTTEYVIINNKYIDYMKNTYEQLVHMSNNWIIQECELGYPLYTFTGALVGAPQKKAKKKSEIQLQTSEINLSDRGFPLTVITCPCLTYKEALVNMFVTSPLVQQALKEEEEYNILTNPVDKKEYTVLMQRTMPVINHEDPLSWLYLDESPIRKCECNQVTDIHLLDDSNQENVLNILSKWHCICGKRLASSQTSTTDIPSISVEKHITEEETDFYPIPLPLRSVKSMTAHSGHVVLNPGDLLRCKYSFSPQVEGNFSVKRFVEVSGWPDSRAVINVNGICDLPRLDNRPKKMFEHFVRRTLEDNVYKITYLEDLKVFEFGPIFIGYNRVYEEEYTMNLRNCSLMTANVDIEFENPTDVFQIDKDFIRLEPGCRDKLTISAAPTEVGVHSSVLLFCVKDNPEIVRVNVACSGVVPIVEILPQTKMIDYGKLLLYRREDERFIIKNDSILPIMWKIRNADEFIENFIIAKTTGIITRHENVVVPVTYIAVNVGNISQKMLLIDIYDELGRGDPMVVDVLYLSAECYDVLVECAYENPTENALNFGNVKVNSTVTREMYLMNRGKYNIYYKLKKVKNFPEPLLLKSFEVTSECGMIPPALKLVSVEFECTPVTSMNLVNVPAFICSLLDGSKDQVVVAKFPVCITIASFYNTFTLFPLGELNFHIIAVGSGVVREVILNNTSKCPFTYEIELPPEHKVDFDTLPFPAKGKDTKIKNPPLRCGNFLILNEDNLLAPGTSRTIQIQFMATAARTFEETIKFVISDTCPAEAQGVPLKLIGTGAMPRLDFWNVETTFREHLILKNLSEYKVPESSPHCVFEEETVTLHFFCVTVNTSYVAAIDLYNDGLVPCILTMKLHYQTNTNQDIFSLYKYNTHVEPLLHKRLDIIFSPKALEEYRAVLEIKLKALQNQEVSFKLCLIGEGVIPRIRLISPPIRQHKLALLKFPVTCLGSITNKGVRFKNVSSVKSTVHITVLQSPYEDRPVFWINADERSENILLDGGSSDKINTSMTIDMKCAEVAKLIVYYNPIKKGRTSCDVTLTIDDNPYEFFTVLCEAEAFMEDVILVGLEMLSMDTDIDAYKMSATGTDTSGYTGDSRKKTKSAPVDKKKAKTPDTKKKKVSEASVKQSDTNSIEPAVLKYALDFGGCELCSIQRRSVIMVNNSEKVYKFNWIETENIIIKPSVGYISPGEEKDMEIMFFSSQPTAIRGDILNCSLVAISDDSLTVDIKGATWDNRQTLTLFDQNRDIDVHERYETVLDEQTIPPSEYLLGLINILVVYSVTTEYTKFKSTLLEEMRLLDTFIYQTRSFDFKVENIGNVPMKIAWNFYIDDQYPARIDKFVKKTPGAAKKSSDVPVSGTAESAVSDPLPPESLPAANNVGSKETLFSGSIGRDSVDTWFEVDVPFKIEPVKECLKPRESRVFIVTFSPLEAFDFKVRLKSSIDNLDPYDQNTSCNIVAKSLIPYVHLDIEETDYLTSDRRKVTGGVALPKHMSVLEFNVLGSGCYKKKFNVINPTNDAYEFVFEIVRQEGKDKELDKELVPVHCNMLKGFVEGGTSTEVTFTFSPTAPGVYESQWKFFINAYHLVINLLVVGIVREPEVVFVPTILIIKNSLVSFTSTYEVVLKNCENQSLNFEMRGNSMCNESGKTPVVVEPERGVLKPCSETPVKVIYTPIKDGPIMFKIFCKIQHMIKNLSLCVNSLSHSITPKVTYYLIGNEHVLSSDANTNIHLEQTASTYERRIPFTVKNNGSATFFFDWHYATASVKKYLQVSVEPKSGHVTPASQVDCILCFTLKQVPVESYPVKLTILDGPVYNISLHAEIEKPLYHFSCREINFGKAIIKAPDVTYKKTFGFTNDDKVPIMLNLNFVNLPELYVDFQNESTIDAQHRKKIAMYFRPKEVKEYELKLQFWVNSLCEEIITVKGEGVPLLVDLYEGCQKSFDLGPVKVGDRIVREIEVMNHSKVPIDASFLFKDMYHLDAPENDTASDATSLCLMPGMASSTAPITPGPSRVKYVKFYKDQQVKEQTEMDVQNALRSLKVVPAKCVIKSHQKVPLKIHFKPAGLISTLKVQLNVKVLSFTRPLVLLSGSATGMSLRLSQNSLQFGRVRKRGCRVLKVMLHNEGDFGAGFVWQPLVTDEFRISPIQGVIAARTNVTFTITFRPINDNPFIKVWACCNIENYKPLELAMYATCIDTGVMQTKTLYLECPVREVKTDYIVVTNPTDDTWFIVSEVSQGPFETLREFHIDPNTTFEIPIHFKPKTMGKFESQLLYSPLGESALFVTLIAAATSPNPNGDVPISMVAKNLHTQTLPVYNITEFPETYTVRTEVVKIVPDKFDGYYEIKHPGTIKVWGEAKGSCRWSLVCFEECEMLLRVYFINVDTQEYQYYNIVATVSKCDITDCLKICARARETQQLEITVRNPLARETEFHIDSVKLDCPEALKISRNSSATLVISYSPLVVGESEEYLYVTNELVGSYVYRVQLQCLPAKERDIEVSTPLGTSTPMRLRVQNRTANKADFTSSITHSSILLEKEYSLGPYEKGKFLVWFEPTELGVQNCRVAFNSPAAGEFVFNIKGIATEPKPQGPYEIKVGGSTTVRFKNVFEDTRTFKIYVDREEFYVKTLYEPIKPKKDLKVVVYLSERPARGWPAPAAGGGGGGAPTGCLTVECDPPEPKVQWTYFLQGI